MLESRVASDRVNRCKVSIYKKTVDIRCNQKLGYESAALFSLRASSLGFTAGSSDIGESSETRPRTVPLRLPVDPGDCADRNADFCSHADPSMLNALAKVVVSPSFAHSAFWASYFLRLMKYMKDPHISLAKSAETNGVQR
jgi:hypothetical protein